MRLLEKMYIEIIRPFTMFSQLENANWSWLMVQANYRFLILFSSTNTDMGSGWNNSLMSDFWKKKLCTFKKESPDSKTPRLLLGWNWRLLYFIYLTLLNRCVLWISFLKIKQCLLWTLNLHITKTLNVAWFDTITSIEFDKRIEGNP